MTLDDEVGVLLLQDEKDVGDADGAFEEAAAGGYAGWGMVGDEAD